MLQHQLSSRRDRVLGEEETEDCYGSSPCCDILTWVVPAAWMVCCDETAFRDEAGTAAPEVWRKVQAELKKSGFQARTVSGYYAR